MHKWLGNSPPSAPPTDTPAEPESPPASLLVPWSEVAQGTALTSVFETDQSSTSTETEQQNLCNGPSLDGHQTSNSPLNETEGAFGAPWPPIPKWFWGALAALILYNRFIYRAIIYQWSFFNG